MRYSRQGGYGTPSLPVLLDLNGTQKRYGGVTALRDGNLSVAPRVTLWFLLRVCYATDKLHLAGHSGGLT